MHRTCTFFVLREAVFATLYALASEVQFISFFAYRNPLLYTKKRIKACLFPLQRKFVDAIRTEGLYAGLFGPSLKGRVGITNEMRDWTRGA